MWTVEPPRLEKTTCILPSLYCNREMKCIEILKREKYMASLQSSYTATQTEVLIISHTEQADHNVTALRGIGTTHKKSEMSKMNTYI